LRVLALGILGVPLLWSNAAVYAKQGVSLGEAIKGAFKNWLETDAEAKAARRREPLSNVPFSADNLSFVDPDRITLVATPATSTDTDQAKPLSLIC